MKRIWHESIPCGEFRGHAVTAFTEAWWDRKTQTLVIEYGAPGLSDGFYWLPEQDRIYTEAHTREEATRIVIANTDVWALRVTASIPTIPEALP